MRTGQHCPVCQILWEGAGNSEEQPEQVSLTREPDFSTDLLIVQRTHHLKQAAASFPYSFDTGIPNLWLTVYLKCLWAAHLCHGPKSNPSLRRGRKVPAERQSSVLSDTLLLGLPQVREMLQIPTVHAQQQIRTKRQIQHTCIRLLQRRRSSELPTPCSWATCCSKAAGHSSLQTLCKGSSQPIQTESWPLRPSKGLKCKTPWKDVHPQDNLRVLFLSQEFKCFDYTEFSYHSTDRVEGNKVTVTVVVSSSLNGWKDAGKWCRHNATKDGGNWREN